MHQAVQTILLEMAALLRTGYILDWADAYERLAKSIVASPEETARKILASYGGMGSINDVVLQIDGRALPDANERFDMLRSDLRRLCLQTISIAEGGSAVTDSGQ
jgi:hypothetical protein